MKTRIISALVATLLLPIALLIFYTPFLNLLVALVSMLAVYEVLLNTKHNQNKLLTITSFSVCLIVPFVFEPYLTPFRPLIFTLYSCLIVFILLKNYKTVKITTISFTMIVAMVISAAFNSAILVRNNFPNDAYFYLIFALFCASLSDIGAYFVGTFFGKHKIAPNISPKKTWEGLFGGIVSVIVFNLIWSWLYLLILSWFNLSANLDWITIIIASPIITIAGFFGDLTASAIKRQYNIKDFGNIMPGHGGVLDRMDSILFTLPATYVFITYFPMIV